jgi:hypothetical protein
MKGLVLSLLMLVLFSACSNPVESEKKCPCNIKIPQLQEDGSYKIEVVQFKTLEDVRKIKSSKIQITMNPRFFTDGSVEDMSPEAQYVINSDNVIVPTRTETAVMFSIYKIMEDLYLFDKKIGADNILSYPLRASLQTKVNRRKGSMNNASYIPLFDRISVLKYEGDKIPVGLNPGVLAHEHFHALFNAIVKPISSTIKVDGYKSKRDNLLDVTAREYTFVTKHHNDIDPRVGYNYLVLRALDEGLADFWANLQTGQINPYLASFTESEMGGRNVLPQILSMYRQDELRAIFDFQAYKSEESVKGDSDRPIHGSIYSNGVRYSNLMRTLSISVGANAVNEADRRAIVGKWMISSLKKLSKVIQEKGQTEALTQGQILNSFVPESSNKETLSEVCENLNSFLINNYKAAACLGY